MLLLSTERFRGYSLLQSAIALAVMALGMFFLVPRLDDLIDEAYQAHVKAVGSALQSGAHFYRQRWMTEEHNQTLDQVQMTENGWPAGGVAGRTSTETDTDRCTGLWNSLLDIEVPTLTTGQDLNADFRAEEVRGKCRYYHQLSGNKYFIEYDTATGRVSWNIR